LATAFTVAIRTAPAATSFASFASGSNEVVATSIACSSAELIISVMKTKAIASNSAISSSFETPTQTAATSTTIATAKCTRMFRCVRRTWMIPSVAKLKLSRTEGARPNGLRRRSCSPAPSPLPRSRVRGIISRATIPPSPPPPASSRLRASAVAPSSSTSTPLRFETSTAITFLSAPLGAGLLRVQPVRLDDPLDELVPDDVLVPETDESDAVERAEDVLYLDQSGRLVARQVDLSDVAGDDHLRAEAEASENELPHLLR